MFIVIVHDPKARADGHDENDPLEAVSVLGVYADEARANEAIDKAMQRSSDLHFTIDEVPGAMLDRIMSVENGATTDIHGRAAICPDCGKALLIEKRSAS